MSPFQPKRLRQIWNACQRSEKGFFDLRFDIQTDEYYKTRVNFVCVWYLVIAFYFVPKLVAGDKVKPIENYDLDSKMRNPEAAVILMTAGRPLLIKIQVDPEGRWFEFKGQKNEPVIFPVEVGKPVILDKIYTDLTSLQQNLFYSETSRYVLKNTDKKQNQTPIHEAGLYYLGSISHQERNPIEDSTEDWIVLQLAQKKYPQLFSKMKHVNFTMEGAKQKYDDYLVQKAQAQKIARLKKEEEDRKLRQQLDQGLPNPQPIERR